MNTKGKSTLLGQMGKLIGFGFADHPTAEDAFIEVVFYQTKTEYVICITEGPMAGLSLSQRASMQRQGLGTEVPGEAFAPFAARSIERDDKKLPYEELKKLFNESMPQSLPGVKLEWHR